MSQLFCIAVTTTILQDNAQTHIARCLNLYLEHVRINRLAHCQPDLNLTEFVWANFPENLTI